MNREKESKKSRFLRLIVESLGSTILDGEGPPFYGFYPSQLQRLIRLVEQETLESAAKVCSGMAQDVFADATYSELATGKADQHKYGAVQAASLLEILILDLKNNS